MALNPYSDCPCGSGKKFKWCCQPYFDNIEKAVQLNQNGQLEMADRLMQDTIKAHPDKPQVSIFYAQILLEQQKFVEAEEVLDKLLEAHPDNGTAMMIKATIREMEGELIGALLLFHRAVEQLPIDAKQYLGACFQQISRLELQLGHVLAAKSAMEEFLKYTGHNKEAEEIYQDMFVGPESRMPDILRNPLPYRPTAKAVPADQLNGKIGQVRRLYESLSQEVPDDPAAWYNLGLACARLGNHTAALEAFEKSLEKEWDDAKAEETATLIEIMLLGDGMEDQSDYLLHKAFFEVNDPEVLIKLIERMINEGKMVAPELDKESGTLSCMLVEKLPSLVDTGVTMARTRGHLVYQQGAMQMWSNRQSDLKTIIDEFRENATLALQLHSESTMNGSLASISQELYTFPIGSANMEAALAKLQENATNFVENQWMNRPRKSLKGNTPIDAAGSPALRKRLLGIIRLLEETTVATAPLRDVDGQQVPITIYDFSRLRSKLGVELQPPGEAPTIAVPETAQAAPEAAPAAAPGIPADLSVLSVAELSGLPTEELTLPQLENAMRAAVKLDARELAVKFAESGAGRPFDPNWPDRYTFFACLIQGAVSNGGPAAALPVADQAIEYDRQHNDGRRVNDFLLRRAQLYAKAGQVDQAVNEFDTLLERMPDEPRTYIAATEAMLSAGQGAKALAFAEKGLQKAKLTNNRDLEGACMELSEAARKQMG